MARLHTTAAGHSLLQKLELRYGTRATEILQTLREELPGLPLTPSCTWTQQSPWLRPSMELNEHILGTRDKGKIAVCAARTLSEAHVEAHFSNRVRIFTNGSVDSTRKFATAAFVIPFLGVEWSARLSEMCNSMIAGQTAITEALRVLQDLPPADVVILSDSRASIQRLRLPDTTDTATREARTLPEQLLNRGRKVTLQWVPSHVGITGNEDADRLKDRVHTGNMVATPVPDPKRAGKLAVCMLHSLYDKAKERRPQIPARYIPIAERYTAAQASHGLGQHKGAAPSYGKI